MKYSNNVYLPFADIIKEYTAKTMDPLVGDYVYVRNIEIPAPLVSSMNNYLSSIGVSNIHNFLAFKRKTTQSGPDSTHIDTGRGSSPSNCSVVIPVSGTENTGMVWYSGDYDTETIYMPGYAFIKVIWKSPAQIAEIKEILSPTLARVNVPHLAYSKKDEYRTVCTLRFKKNETFEYLSERLSKQ